MELDLNSKLCDLTFVCCVCCVVLGSVLCCCPDNSCQCQHDFSFSDLLEGAEGGPKAGVNASANKFNRNMHNTRTENAKKLDAARMQTHSEKKSWWNCSLISAHNSVSWTHFEPQEICIFEIVSQSTKADTERKTVAEKHSVKQQKKS